jgi:hypothetical protein
LADHLRGRGQTLVIEVDPGGGQVGERVGLFACNSQRPRQGGRDVRVETDSHQLRGEAHPPS